MNSAAAGSTSVSTTVSPAGSLSDATVTVTVSATLSSVFSPQSFTRMLTLPLHAYTFESSTTDPASEQTSYAANASMIP